MKHRYDQVLKAVNVHLPPHVPPIETWALEDRPVGRVLQLRVAAALPEMASGGESDDYKE